MSERRKTCVSKGPLFGLGNVFTTPGALKALADSGETPDEFLARHTRGDWGEISSDDSAENEFSLERGFRLLSAYRTRLGTKLWVITEADR